MAPLRLAALLAAAAALPGARANAACNVAEFERPFDPYTVLGVTRAMGAEAIRERYRQIALASTLDRFRLPTCAERWRFHSMQRSYQILQPESAGWREAFDTGKFASQLQLDRWRPKANEAPDLPGRGVAQFFLVDGPVTPEDAAEVRQAVAGELERPLGVFLYSGWDAESQEWAPQYKEAAYTVKEAAETAPGFAADFEAVDCDEPEAAWLCTDPYLAAGNLPGVVLFHAGAGTGERPLSIVNVGLMRDEAGPGPWALAARLTGWLKAEIERYVPDAGMVEVDVEVPIEEAAAASGGGGGDRDGDRDGVVEGGGAGTAGDEGSGGGGSADDSVVSSDGEAAATAAADGAGWHGEAATEATDEQAAMAGHEEDSEPPAEDSQQQHHAAYISANGEFGAPQPSLVGTYSFTPSGAPDPAYEPVPDEDEQRDYDERRAAWEATEAGGGGDGDGGGGGGGDDDGGGHDEEPPASSEDPSSDEGTEEPER